MEKDYQKIREEFIRVSSGTRNKLTALSLTIIAGIYFFSSNTNQYFLKTSLLLFIFTILIEIIADFLKSQHYSLWFEEKIESEDFRESKYGKVAEVLFWIQPLVLLAGIIIFTIGIFK